MSDSDHYMPKPEVMFSQDVLIRVTFWRKHPQMKAKPTGAALGSAIITTLQFVVLLFRLRRLWTLFIFIAVPFKLTTKSETNIHCKKEHLDTVTNLLSSAIAGLNVGGHGGSWCSAAAALSCAVITEDLSLVSFLPHRRRVRLADSTAWFQPQRHR